MAYNLEKLEKLMDTLIEKTQEVLEKTKTNSDIPNAIAQYEGALSQVTQIREVILRSDAGKALAEHELEKKN